MAVKPSRKRTPSKKEAFKVSPLTDHKDLPATVGLVKEVRSEMVSEIQSMRFDMQAMEKRLDGRMDGLEGKISQVLTSVHHTQALMEEQRSENRVVLDGIKVLIERQDRVGYDVKDLRKTIGNLSIAR